MATITTLNRYAPNVFENFSCLATGTNSDKTREATISFISHVEFDKRLLSKKAHYLVVVKIAAVNATRCSPTHYITNHSSPMAISVTYSKIPYAALETLKGLSSPSSGPTIPKPLL